MEDQYILKHVACIISTFQYNRVKEFVLSFSWKTLKQLYIAYVSGDARTVPLFNYKPIVFTKH